MRKINKHITRLVLLLLSATAVVIAAYRLPEKAGQEETDKEMLIQINSGDVQAVVVSNDNGGKAFINTPAGVVVDEDESDKKYDKQKLINLIYSLTHIESDRNVDNTDETEYGFDKPNAQVSILLKDSTVRLTLGRKSPVAEAYYLRNDSSGNIGLISGEAAELIMQPYDDLRDLSLYPAVNSNNLSAIEQIGIIHEGENMVLQQVQSNTHSTFFGLTAPVTAALNWENVYRQILSPLFTFAPEHFVSDDVPLTAYGLDEPEYILQLIINGSTYRCGFSAKDPDTYYCARLDGTTVSEVGRDNVDFLFVSYIDLIGSSVYNKSAADVARLSAKYNGRTVIIDVTGSGEMLTASVGRTQLDSTDTIDLFRVIGNIPLAAVLTGMEEMQQPMLTICYTLRDGSEDILEFLPISDRQCAVYIDGTAEFSTYLTSVKDIISTFDKFQ